MLSRKAISKSGVYCLTQRKRALSNHLILIHFQMAVSHQHMYHLLCFKRKTA